MKKYIYSMSAACILLATLSACNSGKKSRDKFVEISNMDTTVKPGDNFYLYVNGDWIKKTEIPPTETGMGAFRDLDNQTKEHLKTLVEDAAKAKSEKGSVDQKVGDLFVSGMDSLTIEKRGYEPVKPILDQIKGLTDKKSIMQFVASQQTEGDNLLFDFYIGPDEKNSMMNMASFYQGGLGLPDRDYYFKTDSTSQAIIKAYQAYIQKLFTLTGDDVATAEKKAQGVFELEKNIATSHKTNVQLRDPQNNYHKVSVAALQKQMPEFDWTSLLTNLSIKADSINVGQPEFYAKVNNLLTITSPDVWKAYLSFHVLNNAAYALSSNFVNAKFDFIGKTLNGQKQLKPRWERTISVIDNNIGEALGELYVKRYFTADAKKRMQEMVDNLSIAFEKRIDHLDWMSDSTKVKAKGKLGTFLKKIGYPDKWRDYSKVVINKDKYFENLQSCAKNEYQHQISKVGKPVDRSEWGMSPATVNAYYNPTFNEIVFPAAILQFPFFDPNADDAINYGGIGMVIGHEMTHGFDDQGCQYDADGNLKNWWSKSDYDKFKVKADQVINLYNTFTVLDTVHVKGALTNGENIADLGGVAIAYDAFKMTKQGKGDEKIDGFTPDQRFFLSIAQIWRNKTQEKNQLLRINTDPHSPPMYRVNAPLQNFAPFYTAFNIKPGDKMYLPEEQRIKIW